MNSKVMMIATAATLALFGGVAYSTSYNSKTPIEFYKGHSHPAPGMTIGAPEHSGGTDANGCHNASVPYHCH
jgi:hypothetical protein